MAEFEMEVLVKRLPARHTSMDPCGTPEVSWVGGKVITRRTTFCW